MPENLTVTIPTFNRNNFLVTILNTIPKNQTTIISDNGGFVTDEIKNNYPGFLFVKPADELAMFANWNFCISNVKTKWFVIPSDDDLYDPDAFDKINAALEKYDEADIIIFGHKIIDELGTTLSTWVPPRLQVLEKPYGYNYFKYGVEARLPSIIFKTEVAKSYGLFDESYIYTAADSLLIQKCMLNGTTVLIPEIVAAYRIWGQNFTNKYIATTDWLSKIDKWQNDIAQSVIVAYGNNKSKINSSHIKDEVYANNLLVGIANKKVTSGLKDAFLFAKGVRFPWHAKLITKLRIIKALLLK